MTSENRIALRNPKRQFDPTNTEDLGEYKYFLLNQRWRDTCPFVCESPFESVTFMIERKIVAHWIDAMIASVDKQLAA
jgi:hypothetical protein